jgi:Tol biopolymer transport system component
MVWLAVVGAIVLGAGGRGNAEIIMSQPTNVGPPINDAYDVQECDLSHDGLELYYASARPGGYGGWDIWVSKRETPSSPWEEPVNLGPVVNTSKGEVEPSISDDGLELYFVSAYDWGIIRVCRRPSKDAPWGSPVKIGPPLGSNEDIPPVGSNDAWGPDISADGLSLYFASTRVGGYGKSDIWVAKRATTADPWGEPVNLGPNVNDSWNNGSPSISADGLTLVFSQAKNIWVTMRESTDDDWGPRVQLPFNNPPEWLNGPALSPDGSTIYFDAGPLWGGYGDFDFWQVTFTPILDFNVDGKVDGIDLAFLVADWGQKQPLCDIGPLPWGDGVVNEKDLGVLMEALVTPSPRAADIPCDVVLCWTSSFFGESHDVYLGTSFEAVSNASRENRLDVMVGQRQTATTYDPPGMLEFSKTYYWRVDFVTPGPSPTIYQGPVLSFTTEAYARPIKNIIATASSAQPSMGPEKTVDGSGLDPRDGHSTDGKDMWLSTGAQPNWIQYAFDKAYAVHELWIWNSNQLVEPFIGFGAKSVKIEYSTDGTTWTSLANVPEFARASGQEGYQHNTTVSFGGVSAKYVKLTIEKGWGATPSVGLSDVRFFYIPDRSATKP